VIFEYPSIDHPVIVHGHAIDHADIIEVHQTMVGFTILSFSELPEFARFQNADLVPSM
jgi:hypothetical protein